MTLRERWQRARRDKWVWVAAGSAVAHMVATHLVMGIRVEHILANLLLVLPAIWGGKGRVFSILCYPLWLTGASYEYSKYVMFLQGDHVNIREIYDLEKALFGIETDQGRMILSEYFSIHNWPILDGLAGFFYSYYLYHAIFVPMIFIWVCPERQPRMAWGFLTANLIGLTIFLLYPVAPPWYVEMYGFVYNSDAVPSAAGAGRFDDLFGINYFRSFYQHNATVFGAMPSLHVGYPLTVALATMGYKRGWQIFCFAVPTGVAFSAFYLQHHYLLDLLGGAAVAFVSYSIVVLLLHRHDWDRTFKGYLWLLRNVPKGYDPAPKEPS